jgi:hypothetical protein
MAYIQPIIYSPKDEFNGRGVKPIVFDIIAPDGQTSLLSDGENDYRMVLHANVQDISISYEKSIERQQTMGGWIEEHWADKPITISLAATTGGFIHKYQGLVATSGPVPKVGGNSQGHTRRDTIGYQQYLDLLAIFHNNGAFYDRNGNIVVQGRIKMSFDGGVWFGWFQNFSVADAAETPHLFKCSLGFQVEREVHGIRTQIV